MAPTKIDHNFRKQSMYIPLNSNDQNAISKICSSNYYCILKKEQKSNFYGTKAWKSNLFRFSSI